MENPSPQIRSGDLKPPRGSRFGWANPSTQPEWADAEARAYLERPSDRPSYAKILQVVLITVMVVAVLKAAWILAFHP